MFFVSFRFFFVLLFFLLHNALIAMIFDDAIYLFVYFFAFYFNGIASKSHTKNYSENGRETWKKKTLYNSEQIIIILQCNMSGGNTISVFMVSSVCFILALCPQ